MLLEEIRMKSLKGRLIGGEDLRCEGAMAVSAILSSYLVNPIPKCLQFLLDRKDQNLISFLNELAFKIYCI